MTMIKRLQMASTVVLAFVALSQVAPAHAQAPAPGSASEFFMQYRKAFDSAKRIEDVLPFMSAQRRKEVESTPASEREMMFDMIKELGAITNVRIVRETPNAKGATLTVEALDSTKAKTVGTIEIVKEGNAWKLDKESWKSS
jgi:hypothetical protein